MNKKYCAICNENFVKLVSNVVSIQEANLFFTGII